jgi:hypothetical protein
MLLLSIGGKPTTAGGIRQPPKTRQHPSPLGDDEGCALCTGRHRCDLVRKFAPVLDGGARDGEHAGDVAGRIAGMRDNEMLPRFAHQDANGVDSHGGVGQVGQPFAGTHMRCIVPANPHRPPFHSRAAFISRPSQRSTAATSSCERGRATAAISDASCDASAAVSLTGCLLMPRSPCLLRAASCSDIRCHAKLRVHG